MPLLLFTDARRVHAFQRQGRKPSLPAVAGLRCAGSECLAGRLATSTARSEGRRARARVALPFWKCHALRGLAVTSLASLGGQTVIQKAATSPRTGATSPEAEVLHPLRKQAHTPAHPVSTRSDRKTHFTHEKLQGGAPTCRITPIHESGTPSLNKFMVEGGWSAVLGWGGIVVHAMTEKVGWGLWIWTRAKSESKAGISKK